jgi:NAD(P)-dependent dehydrogenase (short-subunit alcohol dehydrogenase family)
MDEFKRLDYAVNCAGVLGAAKKSHEMTLEEFDHIVNVDYRGSWLCSREELKIMVNQEPLPTGNGRQGDRGVIVNVASQLGIVARPQARKSFLFLSSVDFHRGRDTDTGFIQRHIVRPRRL